MSFGQFPPIIGEVPNVFKDKMPTFVIGSVYLLLFIIYLYFLCQCDMQSDYTAS